MSIEREVAVRLFINDKFNTTFGKSLFRKAIFNGTIELKNPKAKFLIDLYQYEKWEAMAKNDIQIETIRELANIGIPTTEEYLFSWIVHYDITSKEKTPVKGFLVYSPESHEIHVNIDSPQFHTQEQWDLRTHACKATGSGVPALIASTSDLAYW